MTLVSPGEVSAVRSWIKRRTDKGVAVSADEVWAYINKRWSHASEAKREELFQSA